ncbi:MAG: serine hydrolase [Pseudomonadales bacterium]|nr:serine hydrolase [Pseudomonadales bacterium]
MNILPKMNATPVILALSLSLVSMTSILSAKPMHKPMKMPIAKAESVGMSTEVLSRIDEAMQEQIDAGLIRGGGATIVARRGKVVHFSTHGTMDVETKTGRAMERDALYIMASSAKPLIGVATLMLVDEGLISLTDPISKFIPEFANQKVVLQAKQAKGDGKKEWRKGTVDDKGKGKQWDKSKGMAKKDKGDVSAPHLVPVETPVTIHHLLTHTSGLTRGGIKFTKADSLATYVPKLAQAPLIFQPGTRWVYGNVGIHDVLPRIIEIISETPFHEFMQERVFNPLEMNNTYFHVPSDKESKLIMREAYKSKGGGGLISAAEDFLHFEQMLLNGGELFGHRLLSPETVKMMGTNQVGNLFATSGKGAKAQKGMGFGYAVAVTLDPITAANSRAIGAFGWGGAAGTVSWTDPENELVGVLMLQSHGNGNFEKMVREAIID